MTVEYLSASQQAPDINGNAGVESAKTDDTDGVVLSCAVIGCTTFLIAFAGAMAASRIPGIQPKKAEIAGGIVLVAIGVKLLLEGLLK